MIGLTKKWERVRDADAALTQILTNFETLQEFLGQFESILLNHKSRFAEFQAKAAALNDGREALKKLVKESNLITPERCARHPGYEVLLNDGWWCKGQCTCGEEQKWRAGCSGAHKLH